MNGANNAKPSAGLAKGLGLKVIVACACLPACEDMFLPEQQRPAAPIEKEAPPRPAPQGTTVDVPAGIRPIDGSGTTATAATGTAKPGLPPTTLTGTTTPISGKGLDLAAGNQHSCAVLDSGIIICWGSNLQGQLGTSGTAMREGITVVPGLTDVRHIATGGRHSCAVRRQGDVWCWGSNPSGALGGGTGTARPTPAQVPGLREVKTLALGEAHSCALKRNGKILCWGSNSQGQLGDGSKKARSRPTPVKGLKEVVELAAGAAHTCARTKRGRVACWGSNNRGQLGDGSNKSRRKPVTVKGLKDVRSIAAAFDHSCAVNGAFQAQCWGGGGGGLQGGKRPAAQKLGNVVDVSPGVTQVCARTPKGEVICLGRGRGASPMKTASGGRLVAKKVAVGRSHACALRSTGSILCWGNNQNGQLGVPNAANSPSTAITIRLPAAPPG